MKKSLLLFSLLLACTTLDGQIESAPFGRQFIDTVTLPGTENYIYQARLMVLPKQYSKEYYNCPSCVCDTCITCEEKTFASCLGDSTNRRVTSCRTYCPLDLKFEPADCPGVQVISKEGTLNRVVIPPLKPNRIYRLEYDYVGKYNLYGLFRMIHEEGFGNFEEGDKTWKDILRIINKQTCFMAIRQIDFEEYAAIYKELSASKSIDNIPDSTLKQILFRNIPVLKFRENSIDKSAIRRFMVWVYNKNYYDTEEADFYFVDAFGTIPDYVRIYEFYERYLKSAMTSNTFNDPREFLEFVRRMAAVELQIYEESNRIRPNFLIDENLKEVILYTQYSTSSTFAKDFKTSYERSLVPDFGYIAYVPSEGHITGGSPYVGVHIGFSPVNKDVPLKLSNLSFWQRSSIHTGVALNSLARDGRTRDFFDNYSLMLGYGVKVFTHGTRLTAGGVFFEKIDPITERGSLAIHPYIGLSIDIEIRKWLQQSIPGLTNNFKEQ